jgi:DNA-binding beta-propeller fold protein YncE
MYVTDLFNQRIQKFAPNGTFEREWGSFGSPDGSMQFPRGITVSPDGETVILTNSENNRIDLFTKDGGFIKSIKAQGQVMGWPHQTAMASDGTLWIADTNKHRVLHIDQNGSILHNWDGGGTVKAPRGIALDDAGRVYVSNSGSNRVDRYSETGTHQLTLASVGTGATNVRQPWNLEIAGTGADQRIYIADGTNSRIVVLSLAGDPVMLLGAIGTGDGEFQSPRSVAVNPVDGTIAVTDFLNNRISLWK